MVKLTILLTFLIVFPLRGQFYTSDFYKDRSEKVSKRNEWMFQQRLYPYVSSEYVERSFRQRDILRQSGLTDNTASWVSLGPNPAEFSSKPATSRVRVIAYDPDITSTIYIGTSNGGVWKTTDGGVNWFPKTDQEVSLSSGALAVYNNWNTNPPQRIVYYGTGEGGFGFVYSYYGRGLLKSTDGGDTWRHITAGLPQSTYFYKIAINPASPNVLLAALGSGYANPVNTGGLYRSEDFGETWTRVVPSSIGEEGLNCTDIVFSPDGTKAYILGPFITGSPNWWENGTGYRVSNDGGRTFSQVPTNLPGTGYLAIHPLSPDIMYALTALDCGTSRLYRSADAGNSWSQINSSFLSNQCGYNMALEMSPTDPNTIFVGTITLYKSTDRGSIFPIEIMPYHADIHDIVFNPKNPNELMVATDGGVVKSTNNGASYLNMNQTLASLECYSVSTSPDDPSHIITGTQDNGVQAKGTSDSPWRGITGYDATTVIISPENQNNYISQLSSSPSGIHASSNRGSTWFVAGGLPHDYSYSWVRSIIKHPTVPNTYYTAAGGNIHISIDNGFTWSIVNSSEISEKINRLAISQSNPAVMFASTGPFEYMPNATQHFMYKSVDGGRTWTNITGTGSSKSSASLPNRYCSAIHIDKDNSDDVIAAFAGFGTSHIYRSYDGGQTWDIMDCDGSRCLPDSPVNDILIRYTPEGLREYYAATDIGVYRNSGENIWHELSEGMPNCVVMDLELNGDKLRAATFGRGVFEWDLSASAQAYENKNITNTKKLNVTNYPNPFNPSTEIIFELPSASHVKITIYDITGREISTLVNDNLEPAVHKLKWNAEKYSSGIYIYRFEANGISQVKKMLLMK